MTDTLLRRPSSSSEDDGDAGSGVRRRRLPTRAPAREARSLRDLRWPAAVGGVLLLAFVLRVWGVQHGLPYAYNADENAHFVPKAIGLFGHGWNPHYFVNPPAYTYLLHVVFAVWFGGREGVSDAYATNPTEVFVVARVTAAAVGTLAVFLLYLAGARLFDRRTGLLAAGLLGVSFLPVFYSHLALNDVPTLAPICLALWGIAGVLRFGRTQDYVLAGAGLGLACATKYTGGIVLLPLLGAAAAQFAAEGGRGPAVRGTLLAAGAAIVAFLLTNPYALLAFDEFKDGLTHQADASGDALGKLGNTWDNGFLYYGWTFTWGLGVIPLVAAIGGVLALLRDERRLIWVLAPAPILFVLFMGSQERFFGRWLLPVFPLVCLLASWFVLDVAARLGRLRPALKPTFVALAVVALCGQAVAASLHNGLTLSNEDTRNQTRDWMVENIEPRSKVVVEPVVPDLWAQDVGNPLPKPGNGYRWNKYPTSRSNIANDGTELPGRGRIVNIEDYERTLFPGLIDKYEASGYCWVVTGFSQRGRAEAEPEVVPRAIAYYAELERRGEKVYVASPYREGAGPVEFNFDWTFNHYPRSYERPGVTMVVYRLRGGACA